ncbi:hypothetical protein PIB30_020596 [Stylosanthes scabra]|uniref:Uncharacterized protein n=1 Tax=Stylosanthes scabra TaxID=79078 RepID=A0ABU6R960_9FABA|nr:hypothetical protein [Stylosanthes scabra]
MRNTIFPPKKRNVVNKAHDDDDVANADEKNKELLGDDSTGFSSKDPNNEEDATLKDLPPYTSKGSTVENIKKESLSPDEKSDGMEKENVKGKNIIIPNDVDGDDSSDDDELDEENDDSDDDDSQGEKRSKQMRKKHKKKTRSIMEIYQKLEAIVPQESSNKSPSPLAVEDLNEVNMLKDNSSFWVSLEASENQ